MYKTIYRRKFPWAYGSRGRVQKEKGGVEAGRQRINLGDHIFNHTREIEPEQELGCL